MIVGVFWLAAMIASPIFAYQLTKLINNKIKKRLPVWTIQRVEYKSTGKITFYSYYLEYESALGYRIKNDIDILYYA